MTNDEKPGAMPERVWVSKMYARRPMDSLNSLCVSEKKEFDDDVEYARVGHITDDRDAHLFTNKMSQRVRDVRNEASEKIRLGGMTKILDVLLSFAPPTITQKEDEE